MQAKWVKVLQKKVELPSFFLPDFCRFNTSLVHRHKKLVEFSAHSFYPSLNFFSAKFLQIIC